MSKTGGKGRISNELVAASCAAVLTVYGAGYWRTRDVARQLEMQARERRVSRPAAPPSGPISVATEATPADIAAEPAIVPLALESDTPKSVEKPAVQVVKAKAPPPSEPEPSKPPAIESIALVETTEPTLAKALASGAGTPPSGQWHDGTYTGWGTSSHGDIEARIVIEGGRIVDSGVATCATRYPCDVIYLVLFQPVERQGASVDRVSRATESADAYYYAVEDALGKAAETPDAPAATPQ